MLLRNYLSYLIIAVYCMLSINIIANPDNQHNYISLSEISKPQYSLHAIGTNSHKKRVALAVGLSIAITAATNYAFPDEVIDYFTNQLMAEVIAAAARDVHIFKKLSIGLLASIAGSSIDWYYMYPVHKRNLALGIAGTQTCIMFLRDWILEGLLDVRLPRIGQKKYRLKSLSPILSALD